MTTACTPVAATLQDAWCCGWISPDGAFHPCAPGDHDALAHTLAARQYHSDAGAARLALAGWLRLTEDGYARPGDGHGHTDAQIAALARLLADPACPPAVRRGLRFSLWALRRDPGPPPPPPGPERPASDALVFADSPSLDPARPSGWLDLDGTCFRCPPGAHTYLALRLCAGLGVTTPNACRVLLQAGWAILTGWGSLLAAPPLRLTPAQAMAVDALIADPALDDAYRARLALHGRVLTKRSAE